MIPKEGKDLRLLASWRPVSILNTDYKILTKTLANRLQLVLPKLISPDQVGYVKNRYIGQNVRLIKDVMTYVNNKGLARYILLLDFEKAFDSIEWSFMFKCLEKYNMGGKFIKWIEILHNQTQSCVTNNGYLSGYFYLGRGIRQGCPISALLFILVAEVLAIKIRNSLSISGIVINKEEYKICQLADDATLFLKNISSILSTISIVEDFQKCSGLKINMQKTILVPLGTAKDKKVILTKHCNQISIQKAPFKTLGIWFVENDEEMAKLNFDRKIEKMQKLTNIWSSRHLSLKGKVTVIKSLIVPQISHLLSMCYCSQTTLEKIDNILFNFLWGKKPPKIKRETIIADFSVGGLRMPDIFTVNVIAKTKWVNRLISEGENHRWTKLFWKMMNLENHLFRSKIPISYKKKCHTIFHQQIVESWFKLKCKPPLSAEEIGNEYIFDNTFIRSNKDALDCLQFKIPKSIAKDIQVKHVMDSSGHLLKFQEVKGKINWNISIYSYNIITQAIPKDWKNKMKENPLSMNLYSEYQIRIKDNIVTFHGISNKALYWEMIHCKEPTSITTWVDIFPFLETISWNKVFMAIHNTCLETYLQSFQYKILHRILNTNYNLYKWKIIEKPFCNYCNNVDTIEHHLYLCGYSKQFWEKLENWIKNAFGLRRNLCFTICEVIFGIKLDDETRSLNKILIITITIAKWYINHCRTQIKELNFPHFLSILREKFKIYKCIFRTETGAVNRGISELLDEKWNSLNNKT